MDIKIYGNSETCSNCLKLKKYLDEKEINYTYYDLAEPDSVKRIQYKSFLFDHKIKMIPATFIDDREVIIGFDEKLFDEILK
jgi:glutaredoxin